eukprot:TRINITY_DN17960_c0_g1_i1.p2 TRINITY_DN17960_c0_g1~~TRINITY_DN17960_c0_g1_i1.p2  ORF type:complete len:299 (-),score=52.20 TRINITY_DN17960_c0_g1_i1:1247-2143(-)
MPNSRNCPTNCNQGTVPGSTQQNARRITQNPEQGDTMASFFRANEIAKTAVEVEKKGRAFYLRLEESARNPKTRELFHYLAVEESKHEVIFQALLDRLGEIELPAWATSEEYGGYIQGLIESHALFSDQEVAKRVDALDDEKEAIRMAMTFEKDSILFFTEMESFVPDKEKAAVRECIQEERLHLARLQAMYSQLQLIPPEQPSGTRFHSHIPQQKAWKNTLPSLQDYGWRGPNRRQFPPPSQEVRFSQVIFNGIGLFFPLVDQEVLLRPEKVFNDLSQFLSGLIHQPMVRPYEPDEP